ncbi:flagellar M-ring protein FliF C-terminal domain-containing protein, partial [Rhizobium ruizarguesonis]
LLHFGKIGVDLGLVGGFSDHLGEMQKIVASAAGIDAKRGDVVTVTAMDFLENQLLEDATGGVRVMEMLSRNLAGIINSLAFVAVALV